MHNLLLRYQYKNYNGNFEMQKIQLFFFQKFYMCFSLTPTRRFDLLVEIKLMHLKG